MPSSLQSLLVRPAFRNLRLWRPGGKVWRMEKLHFMEEDQIREYFSKLDIYKSMSPDGICP